MGYLGEEAEVPYGSVFLVDQSEVPYLWRDTSVFFCQRAAREEKVSDGGGL